MDFALDKGLFVNAFQSETFKKLNLPGKKDFMELSRRLGVDTVRAEKLLLLFLAKHEIVETQTHRSFLEGPVKRGICLTVMFDV